MRAASALVLALPFLCTIGVKPASAAVSVTASVRQFTDLKLGQTANAVLNDFCDARQHLYLLTTNAVSTPSADGDRIEVTRTGAGVAVLIVPGGPVETGYDALGYISDFMGAASGRPCPAASSDWPVMSTSVEGLRFEKGSDGRLHANYLGKAF